MKLKFTVESEDYEREEIETYLKCNDFRFAIDDILQHLRKHLKYEPEDERTPGYEKIKEFIWETLNERGIANKF